MIYLPPKLLLKRILRRFASIILEATCFDDGEEVPAEFGFGGGGEEEGDYNVSESSLQEGGQTCAYAGSGVNAVDVDDEAGVPEFGEGFKLGVEGGVAGACPEFTVANKIAWGLDKVVFEGGKIYLDDSEGVGVTCFVHEVGSVLREVGCGCFVLAGDVDEEGELAVGG
jgi:hypothetical protein